MCTKNTRELEEILENTHTGTYDQYCRTYEDSLLPSLNPFGVYLKECRKNMKCRSFTPKFHGMHC